MMCCEVPFDNNGKTNEQGRNLGETHHIKVIKCLTAAIELPLLTGRELPKGGTRAII